MELDIKEALRYLGVKEPVSEQMCADVRAVADTLRAALTPQYTYRLLSLEHRADNIYLPEVNILLPGSDAKKMLGQCHSVVLLACTLGARFETMMRAQQVRDMAGAVILDACADVWVEAGCDQIEQELKQRLNDSYLTDRFSPGYGDLPLSLQRDICCALDTPRRLGLYVTEQFLLNPVKSVTALIGVSNQLQAARIRGCAYCSMKETCTLRKGGTHCANQTISK